MSDFRERCDEVRDPGHHLAGVIMIYFVGSAAGAALAAGACGAAGIICCIGSMNIAGFIIWPAGAIIGAIIAGFVIWPMGAIMFMSMLGSIMAGLIMAGFIIWPAGAIIGAIIAGLIIAGFII